MIEKQLRGQTKVVGTLDDAGSWAPLRVHLFASDSSAEELRFPENSYSAKTPEEAALAVHSLLANKEAGALAILVETDHGDTLNPQAVTPFVPPQDPGLAALTECLVLTEHNDHEGETWSFFVPVEGNEEAVDLIERYVKQVRDEDEYPYEVERLRVHLNTVEIVATHEGYMASHTIIPKLDLAKVREQVAHLLKPEATEEEDDLDEDLDEDAEGKDYEDEDPLYKGGLLDLRPSPSPDEAI